MSKVDEHKTATATGQGTEADQGVIEERRNDEHQGGAQEGTDGRDQVKDDGGGSAFVAGHVDAIDAIAEVGEQGERGKGPTDVQIGTGQAEEDGAKKAGDEGIGAASPKEDDGATASGEGRPDDPTRSPFASVPGMQAPSTPNKVHVIEESGHSTPENRSGAVPSPSMRPEPMQHRHSGGNDRPSSYQPSAPSTYMQLKALALQLPAASATGSQSNSHHIDPPTLILEGRTNLSTARRSFYPRVNRTLPELQLWILALTLSFPAGIFSPFSYPPSSLVSGGNMEDGAIRSYLMTITNQFARILRKPYVLSHPATVALVDCDFSYNPGMPHVGPGSSVSTRRKLEDGIALTRAGHDPLRGRKGKNGAGSSPTATWDADGVAAALGLPSLPSQASADTYTAPAPSTSKNPLSIFSRASASPQRIQPHPPVPIPPGEEDEDEEDLTAARNEITRLELQFEKASRATHLLVDRSGAMTATIHQLSAALTDLARLDEGRTIAKRAKEGQEMATLTKGLEAWSAAQAGANAALMGTIVPSMAYQSLNARAAIDALLRRAAAATHRHSALVVLVQKRREAERLKRARGEIRQEDVDWVLQELRDAQRTTQVLTHHLSTFTSTLKEELKEHSRNTHTDIQDALLNHARNSMRAHKFVLNNLIRARDGLVALREGRTIEEISVPPLAPPILVHQVPEEAEVGMNATTAPFQHDAAKSATNGHLYGGDSNEEGEYGNADQNCEDVESAQLPSSASTTSVNKDLPEAPRGEDHDGRSQREEEEERTAQSGMTHADVHADPVTRPTEAEETGNPVFAVPPPPVEASPWHRSEPIIQDSAAFGTQSTILPPRSPGGEFGAQDPPLGSRDAASGAMSQSAFLPGRDMSRYANPFARMDGFGGTSSGAGGLGSAPPNPFVPSYQGASSQSMSPPMAPSAAGKGNKPTNDVWANRSRLSASDAARSLAGRF